MTSIRTPTLHGQDMADILTKEMRLPPGLENVILKKVMDLPETHINQVKAVATELRILNIQNRRPAV